MSWAMDPADLLPSDEPTMSRTEVDRFRSLGAIAVAAFAALLAIGSVGGGNASDDVLQLAVGAADAYAFFQAQNIRQTDYESAVDELRLRLDDPDLAPTARSDVEALIADYQATIDRYESEPDPEAPDDPLRGEGKIQLLAQAQDLERRRDTAGEQAAIFDLASAALQIAIVVMSVSLLITSRRLAAIALVVGGIGALLVVDGFILLAPLPF